MWGGGFLCPLSLLLPAATAAGAVVLPHRNCTALVPHPPHLQVFNEDRKQINGLLLVHLPDGPTAQFRLSSLVLSADIKVGAHA